MCNTLKTADCIAKRMNIWDSWFYELYTYGTFRVSLGSVDVLCKISNIKICKGYCSQSFLLSQPNRIKSMVIEGGKHADYYFYGDMPNLKKKCYFEIFVNTGPYRARHFKMLLLLEFSSDFGQTFMRI